MRTAPKKDEVVYDDIGSVYCLAEKNSADKYCENSLYKAYFFYGLLVDNNTPEPDARLIRELDFDSMNIRLVYPVMIIGTTHISNTVSYSGQQVKQLLAQPVASTDTIESSW